MYPLTAPSVSTSLTKPLYTITVSFLDRQTRQFSVGMQALANDFLEAEVIKLIRY